VLGKTDDGNNKDIKRIPDYFYFGERIFRKVDLLCFCDRKSSFFILFTNIYTNFINLIVKLYTI